MTQHSTNPGAERLKRYGALWKAASEQDPSMNADLERARQIRESINAINRMILSDSRQAVVDSIRTVLIARERIK